jgi:hypothetical protein
MGYWNMGILEWWVLKASFYYSIIPTSIISVLQALLFTAIHVDNSPANKAGCVRSQK